MCVSILLDKRRLEWTEEMYNSGIPVSTKLSVIRRLRMKIYDITIIYSILLQL
jgi:hypothetical protein